MRRWCCRRTQTYFVVRDSKRFQGNARPTFSEITAALNTLGVGIDNDPKQLKKSYLDLVRKHHPDTGGDPEKMKDLTTSYNLLNGLFPSERSTYKTQATLGRRKPSTSTSSGATGPSGGASAYGSTDFSNARYAYDFQRMYEQQQRTRDFQYRYSQHTNPISQPFRPVNPFSAPFGQTRYNILRLPTSTLFFRMFCGYVIFSAVAMYLYRQYRDWLHDDGWRASESLTRQEKIEDMYRVRQDLLARMAESTSPTVRRAIEERLTEQRAMEYAARRQRDNAVLQRTGYQNFHPGMGALFKEPDEPDGCIHFEPRNDTMRAVGVPPVPSSSYDPRAAQQAPSMANVAPPGAVASPPSTSPGGMPQEQQRLPRSREEAVALAEQSARAAQVQQASASIVPLGGSAPPSVGTGQGQRVPTLTATPPLLPYPGVSAAPSSLTLTDTAGGESTGRPRHVFY